MLIFSITRIPAVFRMDNKSKNCIGIPGVQARFPVVFIRSISGLECFHFSIGGAKVIKEKELATIC